MKRLNPKRFAARRKAGVDDPMYRIGFRDGMIAILCVILSLFAVSAVISSMPLHR